VAKSKRAEPKKNASKIPTVHIGSLVREHILARGLNQAEVARRSFMTPQTLSGVLKRSSVQLETLIRISLATEHDFLADISARTMGAIAKKGDRADASEPQVNYHKPSGRAPIRFVIEADPADAQTLRQVTELLRGLKGGSSGR